MITTSSIELTQITDKCSTAFGENEGCSCLLKKEEGCGTAVCPFFKPEGLKDWIRVEDEDGINLIPPEEYYVKPKETRRVWRITRRSSA